MILTAPPDRSWQAPQWHTTCLWPSAASSTSHSTSIVSRTPDNMIKRLLTLAAVAFAAVDFAHFVVEEKLRDIVRFWSISILRESSQRRVNGSRPPLYIFRGGWREYLQKVRCVKMHTRPLIGFSWMSIDQPEILPRQVPPTASRPTCHAVRSGGIVSEASYCHFNRNVAIE